MKQAQQKSTTTKATILTASLTLMMKQFLEAIFFGLSCLYPRGGKNVNDDIRKRKCPTYFELDP